MTCKEAEQMVMPYINDELTDKELEAFLEHIDTCASCYEELDGDGTETQDMHNLLPDALHASWMHIRGRKILNIYYVLSQTLAMLALTAVMIMEILKI